MGGSSRTARRVAPFAPVEFAEECRIFSSVVAYEAPPHRRCCGSRSSDDITAREKPPSRVVVHCGSNICGRGFGGRRWRQLPVQLVSECAGGAVIPRVTCLLPDPERPECFWAGVEIDGVRRTEDGGDTWTAHNEGLTTLDIHGLAVLPGSGGAPLRLVATTNADISSRQIGRIIRAETSMSRPKYVA